MNKHTKITSEHPHTWRTGEQINNMKIEGIKSKCCNASVHKSYDKFSQDEFWCDKCDKECKFYEDKQIKEILQEFDEKFCRLNKSETFSDVILWDKVKEKELKNFLKTSLQNYRTKVIEEVSEKLPKEKENNHQEDGQDCGCCISDEFTPCENENEGFNDCRTETIKLIKELK